MSPSPIPSHRVLPTLNEDGSRKRVRPKLFQGKLLRKRRIVAWFLLALFVTLPFLRVGGRPAVFLDLLQRQFTFFGHTFLATDGVLLMLLLLVIFVAIMAITAVWGRVFCGWACPQTVYLEFVFRPIERLFEGDRNAQLRRDRDGGGIRRVLKNITFAVVSLLVANVFLAYFVGTDVLERWMLRSPLEHPGGFAVMGMTAGLVFADFAYFREQMCTVACPYARLQSVLLDPHSLIVAYDAKRGEPRKKGKPVPGGGDCIDCNACVVACPTGIDIRDGLQLECVACGQCIDACNTIMPKIGKPLDLIRLATEQDTSLSKAKLLRPRVLVYLVLVAALGSALFFLGNQRGAVDVTVLRGIGAPFTRQAGEVQNQLRVKVVSHESTPESYELSLWLQEKGKLTPASQLGIRVIAPENPLRLGPLGSRTTSLFVLSSASHFRAGRLPIVVRVTPGHSPARDSSYVLLGPSQLEKP